MYHQYTHITKCMRPARLFFESVKLNSHTKMPITKVTRTFCLDIDNSEKEHEQ